MAKYRKKPVVIEAEQWFAGQNPETYPECVVWDHSQGCYIIRTLEGPMRVSDGDWVITGVNGEHYPCKPDIFEKTYEPEFFKQSDIMIVLDEAEGLRQTFHPEAK